MTFHSCFCFFNKVMAFEKNHAGEGGEWAPVIIEWTPYTAISWVIMTVVLVELMEGVTAVGETDHIGDNHFILMEGTWEKHLCVPQLEVALYAKVLPSHKRWLPLKSTWVMRLESRRWGPRRRLWRSWPVIGYKWQRRKPIEVLAMKNPRLRLVIPVRRELSVLISLQSAAIASGQHIRRQNAWTS